MTKADYISLIVELMECQGIEDQEQFDEFVTEILPTMTMRELEEQVEILENVEF